jgi:alkylhydroperoxidase family enzyme
VAGRTALVKTRRMAELTWTGREATLPRPSPSARLVAWLSGVATGNDPLLVFSTIGRHRRLFRWWLPFAGSLLRGGRLATADTELLILRTAWNCDGWYEWVQHVPLVSRAGLSATRIAAVAEGPSHTEWTSRQRLLIEAADELHGARVVSTGTWKRLSQHLTFEQCMELCFVVGHYEMLAMALNSLGVKPESSAVRKLDPVSTSLAARLADRLRSARGDCDSEEPPI